MVRIQKSIESLREIIAEKADPEKAVGMSKYMRNLFPFAGISSPERKELVADFRRVFKPATEEELISWVNALWELPEREYQYIGMDYLQREVKLLSPDAISWFEYLITTKSWWDTVDLISGNYLGKFLRRHEPLFSDTVMRFREHENMWINRAAIICQLGYRESTDTQLLTAAIEPHLDSKEFFLQKAIGWSLRQYAKTNPAWVWQFVESHALMPLSRREALKHLSK